MTEKKLKPHDIIIWGRSLGAGIATNLAVTTPEPPRALVTEAAFTSLPMVDNIINNVAPSPPFG